MTFSAVRRLYIQNALEKSFTEPEFTGPSNLNISELQMANGMHLTSRWFLKIEIKV